MTGLETETDYELWATQVIDGEESPESDAVEESTLSAGALADLTSENAVVTNEVNLLGNTAAGDVWTVGFNKPIEDQDFDVAVEDDDGDQFVVNVTAAAGGDADYTLNSLTSTFEGETYAPGALVEIELNTALVWSRSPTSTTASTWTSSRTAATTGCSPRTA